MPSPFPGMDPYLELPGRWEVVHALLPAFMMGPLNRQIRPKYIAQVGTQIYIDETEASGRDIVVPDAFVMRDQAGHGVAVSARKAKAPAIVQLPATRVRKQHHVKIYDKNMQRVVTAIELLSPVNKCGAGRVRYLNKREEYRSEGINLVEIDLHRGGQRVPTEESLPPADYYVLVCRGTASDRAEVWPIGVREKLPRVPIPLDPEDPDAHVDLQALFERVYTDAGWLPNIYQGKLDPPLRGADAAWARDLVTRLHKPTSGRRKRPG